MTLVRHIPCTKKDLNTTFNINKLVTKPKKYLRQKKEWSILVEVWSFLISLFPSKKINKCECLKCKKNAILVKPVQR